MSVKHTLFRNAAVLTAAGIISRGLGFFFRIFLSHAFGEESVGLYQITFPLYALCLSVSTAGLQAAVSRITAEKYALGKPDEAESILKTALCLAVSISIVEILLIQGNASRIAVSFLGDRRCRDLVHIISYALPFAAVHSCICGQSLGMQDTKLPAISQLIEQGARILSVFIVYALIRCLSGGQEFPSIRLAAAGIVAGELAATAFSVRSLSLTRRRSLQRPCRPVRPAGSCIGRFRTALRELLAFSLPLTANRTALSLLQSIEAASVPVCLQLYGMTSAEALRTYGVMTGMALPCILFPSAVTGSVSTVLLPAVSAASTSGNRRSVLMLLRRSVLGCISVGMGCCLFFLIAGEWIGQFLFHSSDAGHFIITLAWICPFLYTNSALLSALNGCGRTGAAFGINMAGLLIRIAGVFLVIPRSGIQGWLWTLLASQAVISALAFCALAVSDNILKKRKEPPHQ